MKTRALAVSCFVLLVACSKKSREVPDAATKMPVAFEVASLAVGAERSCVLGVDGSVRCWGANTAGDQKSPVVVPNVSAVEITTNAGITCARDKSSAVSCWTHWTAPQQFFGVAVGAEPTPVAALAGMTQVAINFLQTCARNKDGAVFWAGSERATTNLEEFRLPDVTAAEVATGAGFACVRDAGGGVHCMGHNDKGQLAQGHTETLQKMTPVNGLTNALQIAAGGEHACVKKTDEVLCWGSNGKGQLGDGTLENKTKPTRVSGLGAVAAVALGSAHSCARKDDGTVVCWGDNEDGQLGDGTTTLHPQPTPVSGLTDVVELGLGTSHTCARKRDRTVWCWGDNRFGAVGDGTNADRTVPTRLHF